MEAGRCLGCGRVVKPHLGEPVYHRPDGSAWWLHRGARCAELYGDLGAFWNRRRPPPQEATA